MALTLTTAAPAAAPTALMAEPGVASVDLSWTAPSFDGGSAITKHQFCRKTSAAATCGDTDWEDIANSAAGGANDVSFTVSSGLTNGTQYFFRVRAVNAVGPGPASSPASATPPDPPDPPDPPTNLQVYPGSEEVTLGWTKGHDGGGAIAKHQYQEKVGGSTFGSWMDIPDSGARGANTRSFTRAGLTNGTEYTYQVRAVNASGNSGASNEASATPSNEARPSAVRSLRVSKTGNGWIGLDWEEPVSAGSGPDYTKSGRAFISSYEYRQSEDGGTTWGEWTDVEEMGNEFLGTGVIVTSLTNGTRYHFLARAGNTWGPGPAPDTVSGTPEIRWFVGAQTWLRGGGDADELRINHTSIGAGHTGPVGMFNEDKTITFTWGGQPLTGDMAGDVRGDDLVIPEGKVYGVTKLRALDDTVDPPARRRIRSRPDRTAGGTKRRPGRRPSAGRRR